jgi:hypothetical protein
MLGALLPLTNQHGVTVMQCTCAREIPGSDLDGCIEYPDRLNLLNIIFRRMLGNTEKCHKSIFSHMQTFILYDRLLNIFDCIQFIKLIQRN